jgi:hypothetical protein
LSCLPVFPSDPPHGTTRLPFDEFWWNLTSKFFFFSKIRRETSIFIKIRQEELVFYVKTFSHLWHLAEFFLQREMFQIEGLEKIRTHMLCSIPFFQWSCLLWDNVKKYSGAREAAIWRRVACWISKATRAQAHAHTPATSHPPPPHTHTYVIVFAFPPQQLLCECVSLLRYAYIACLVLSEDCHGLLTFFGHSTPK